MGLFRQLPHALPLALWLGSGLLAAPYVHMAAKYLLPGVPAAALLIVLRRLDQLKLHLLVGAPGDEDAVLVEMHLVLQMVKHRDIARLQFLQPVAPVIHHLRQACVVLARQCVVGITANEARLADMVRNTVHVTDEVDVARPILEAEGGQEQRNKVQP